MAIDEGYDARHRQLWSATRWQTFQIMGAIAGRTAMNESGIYNPTDLIRFFWEEDTREVEIDDNYVNEMQELIASVNSRK